MYVVARTMDGARMYLDVVDGQVYYRWFASCAGLWDKETAEGIAAKTQSAVMAWVKDAKFAAMDVNDAIRLDAK